jgi:hypothetical protein
MYSKYEQYLTVIREYINGSFEGMALALRGDWGSGKTYFIKRLLQAHLKENRIELEVVYVSLNGISSTGEIYDRLLTHFLSDSTWKNMTYNGLNTLVRAGVHKAGFLGDNDVSKIRKMLLEKGFPAIEDKLLCFDDLERIETDQITYKQVFGFINNEFLEHKRIKTIFIHNDLNIEEADYADIREKYVYKDVSFEPDLKAIYPDLIGTYSDHKSLYKYLTENDTFVLRLIVQSGCSNIRTFKYFLDTLSVIFGGIEDNQKVEVLHSIALFTFVCASEYKLGTFLKFKGKHDFIIKNTTEYQIMQIASGRSESDNQPTEEEQQKHRIYELYIAHNEDHYQRFMSIVNYINDGFLDRDLLQLELRTLTEDGKPEHELALSKLSEFRGMEQEEFSQAYQLVLLHLQQNNYSLYSLPVLANLLFFLQDNDLVHDDVDVLINSAIETGLESYEYERMQVHSFRHSVHELPKRANQVKARILTRMNEIGEELVKTNTHEFFRKMFEESEIDGALVKDMYESPILNQLDSARFEEYLNSSLNDGLFTFVKFLADRFDDGRYRYIRNLEQDSVQRIGNVVKDRITQDSPDSVRGFLMKAAVRYIDSLSSDPTPDTN